MTYGGFITFAPVKHLGVNAKHLLFSLRRFPGLMAATFLFVVIVFLTVSSAAAREDNPLLEFVYGDDEVLDASGPDCCKTVFGSAQMPSWVNRVLLKLQGDRSHFIELQQSVLFKSNGKPTYLVLIWRNSFTGFRRFQLYRVKVKSPNNVRLSGLVDDEDSLIDIIQPTGNWVAPGGNPILVVRYGSGGSGYFGYYLKFLRLSESGVNDVTPQWIGRPTMVKDLNGDGRYEVIASDDRWGNFYHGCGSCGPHTPVIVEQSGANYRPACRLYRDHYLDFSRKTKKSLGKTKEQAIVFTLEKVVQNTLFLIQGGMIAEAERNYEGYLRAITDGTLPSLTQKNQLNLRNLIERTRKTFDPVIAQANKYADVQCPLGAVDVKPDHTGAIERARYFTIKD